MGGTPPPPYRFQKFFVQDIFSSIHTSCVNFIKIAPLLRAVSIQAKNIGLWGVPLPPDQFQKFFVWNIFSSIHTFCVNFVKIATLLRVVSIQVKNIGLWEVPLPPVGFNPFAKLAESSSTTHILVFVSSKSVKNYSSYREDKIGIQRTGYRLTMTPPKID